MKKKKYLGTCSKNKKNKCKFKRKSMLGRINLSSDESRDKFCYDKCIISIQRSFFFLGRHQEIREGRINKALMIRVIGTLGFRSRLIIIRLLLERFFFFFFSFALENSHGTIGAQG